MKFDVVFCNPPYKEKTNSIAHPTRATRRRWNKHLQNQLCLINDNGFLLCVLPRPLKPKDGEITLQTAINSRFELLNVQNVTEYYDRDYYIEIYYNLWKK